MTKLPTIKRAGIIPFYVDDYGVITMMFMVPSDPQYGGSDFQISKGQLDPHETPLFGAIREGEEELGLRRENFLKEPWLAISPHSRPGGSSFPIFVVPIVDRLAFNDPHYETGRTAWLTNDEFQLIGREWQRDLVAHAFNLMHKDVEQSYF